MEALDLGTVYFFSTHRTEALNTLTVAVTTLGNFMVLGPVALVLAIILGRVRGGRTAALFATAAVCTWLMTLTAQLVVDRPRPDVFDRVIPTPSVPSFPSGHASNSMLIYGLFGLLVTRTWRSLGRRVIVCSLLFLLAFLIGVTRLYLAVHFVSDVLGGWLLGLGMILLAYGLDTPATPTPVGTTASAEPA